MTVEAALTRKLGITFMDARAIATESKLNLNVIGYPSQAQKESLIAEAVRIFEKKTDAERRAMKVSRDTFEQTKIDAGSSSSIRSANSSTHETSHSSEFSIEFSSGDTESGRTANKRFSFVSSR